jgi:GAF domain-containing protein
LASPAVPAPHGSPLAGVDARAMLESLSATEPEARPPTLLLHLLNAALGCQWSAVHAIGADGKLKLLAVAAASSAGGSVGLFDFLGHDTERASAALADKAIKLGTQAPARGSVAGLLHCAALAVPLLDAGGAGVGCVTLLSKDASRAYSRDEQAMVATLGPLLSLHATRASLREQVGFRASWNAASISSPPALLLY